MYFSFCIFFVHACLHVSMRRWRPEVDLGYLPWLLSSLFTVLISELTNSASLTSQLGSGIPCLGLLSTLVLKLKLQVLHSLIHLLSPLTSLDHFTLPLQKGISVNPIWDKSVHFKGRQWHLGQNQQSQKLLMELHVAPEQIPRLVTWYKTQFTLRCVTLSLCSPQINFIFTPHVSSHRHANLWPLHTLMGPATCILTQTCKPVTTAHTDGPREVIPDFSSSQNIVVLWPLSLTTDQEIFDLPLHPSRLFWLRTQKPKQGFQECLPYTEVQNNRSRLFGEVVLQDSPI